ncbi:MAG: hypothetical protein ACKO0M_15845 [Cyanobium sp.]
MSNAAPSRSREWLRLAPAPLTLLLTTLMAGCSGSRFGDALSRSFSTPPAEPPPAATPRITTGGGTVPGSPGAGTTTPGSPKPGAATAQAGTGGSDGNGTGAPGRPAGTPTGSSTPVAAATVPRAGGAPPTPRQAPYRVTILLPQADAAAPAEVVTQALRAAGVPFEVETIERLGRNAPAEAPVSRPAPDPR